MIHVERTSNPELKLEDIVFDSLTTTNNGKISSEKTEEVRQLATDNSNNVYYYNLASGNSEDDKKLAIELMQKLSGVDNVRFFTKSDIEQQATLAQNRILECLCDMDLIQEHLRMFM